jgi:hypothetical protein
MMIARLTSSFLIADPLCRFVIVWGEAPGAGIAIDRQTGVIDDPADDALPVRCRRELGGTLACPRLKINVFALYRIPPAA